MATNSGSRIPLDSFHEYEKVLANFKISVGRSMSAFVAAQAPGGRSSSGFRLAMLLPGALVTFLLILFALGLVLFLAFRGNDGSLLLLKLD